MKTISISIIALFINLWVLPMHSQCYCNQLKEAFYSTTKFANSGDYVKDVRKFYGTTAFSDFIKEKEKDKGKYKIAIPVEGVPWDAKQAGDPNKTDYDVVKDNILNGSTDYYNIGWANYMLAGIISDTDVEAYFKCTNSCAKSGLSVSVLSDNTNKMALLLKWNAAGEVKEASIKNIIIYGADIINPINIRANTVIDATGKIVALKRKQGEDLVISINMKDDKGTYYINYAPKTAMPAALKDECKGEWLNSNVNFDSLMINAWTNCSENLKKTLTAEKKDVLTNPKYNNLKNMIYALNGINSIKNNFSSLIADPNKNSADIFLQQAKLETFETQYNTERTAYLGNSHLINPCNTCYPIY